MELKGSDGWEGKAAMPEKELKPRVVRRVDLIAELLDDEANRMPPSRRDEAQRWHKMADELRKSTDARTIRVWEP